ncbi:MAG: chr [Rickettsiaceae bacterium]|jgi:chromate transporter|nr:chr [Rickettsiaceae bacterium]
MNLWKLFKIFLRFGFLAWGGPVAQIGMIKDELVDKERWISQEKFKRVLAVYQALPGPEAHELCVYFGMMRGGRLGGFLAGLGFMLPGFVLMVLLSWAYTIYGSVALLPVFAGVTPAVSALIARAAHRIGSHILHSKSSIYVAIISMVLTFLQMHFLLVFLICVLFRWLWVKNKKLLSCAVSLTLIAIFLAISYYISELSFFPSSKSGLFVEGLKAGLLSFGGAYTAIPFLQNSMVGNYDSITTNSFLDGIALANVIPAPLVIFGTFLGFLVGNFSGALLITIGIFLPAFSFTLLGHKQLEQLIENKTFHGTLDSISAAVVGMLIVTAFQIFLHAVTTPLQTIIFVIALAALYLWKWRWSNPMIIISCGIFGYFLSNF